MTWDEWLSGLNKQEAEIARHFPLDSVERRNVSLLQSLTDALTKKCANPFCRWPIKVYRDSNFAVPFVGDVCETCHDLYTAISVMNPLLKRSRYFHDAHAAWVIATDEAKKRRRNMGLDDSGATGGIL